MRGWDRTEFLAAFRSSGTIADACRSAGVARSTVYAERQRNEEFALAWHDINEEVVERLEAEAYRRAVDGVERLVVSCGRIIGTEREYSDALLVLLLKARRPDVYCDRVRVVHVLAPAERLDLALLSDDEFETFDRLLRKAAGEEPTVGNLERLSSTLFSKEGRALCETEGAAPDAPDASRSRTCAREADRDGGAA